MKPRVHALVFSRDRDGWSCGLSYTLRVAWGEEHEHASGRANGHSLLTLLVAWWRARREMRGYCKILRRLEERERLARATT